MDDLLEAIRANGRMAAKIPPGKGWCTMRAMAKAEGITVPALKHRMDCAKRRGIQIESARGTELDSEGRARQTTYYRLKNEKPRATPRVSATITGPVGRRSKPSTKRANRCSFSSSGVRSVDGSRLSMARLWNSETKRDD